MHTDDPLLVPADTVHLMNRIGPRVVPLICVKGGGKTSGGGGGGGGGGDGGTSIKAKRRRDEDDAADALRDADDRQRKRRRRDDDDRKDEDRDTSQIAELRGNSYLCYALDMRTQQWYVGYSGGGSVVTSYMCRQGDRIRRGDRVTPIVGRAIELEDRNIYQCAEVAALNNALSWGADERDLVFITYSGHQGQRNDIKDPCRNCIQWIRDRCKGYINQYGVPVLFR